MPRETSVYVYMSPAAYEMMKAAVADLRTKGPSGVVVELLVRHMSGIGRADLVAAYEADLKRRAERHKEIARMGVKARLAKNARRSALADRGDSN